MRKGRPRPNPLKSCAWCGRSTKNREVLSLGAKARPGIDLSSAEGTVIMMTLLSAERVVPAMVVTSDSQAKREGNDLAFMLCSEACGRSLQAALEADLGKL